MSKGTGIHTITAEDVGYMIRQAILAERKRLGAILRGATLERDWDSVNGSRPDFDMTMVALAEEIENSPLGDP